MPFTEYEQSTKPRSFYGILVPPPQAHNFFPQILRNGMSTQYGANVLVGPSFGSHAAV